MVADRIKSPALIFLPFSFLLSYCEGVQEDPSERDPIANSPLDEYSSVGSGGEEEAGTVSPRPPRNSHQLGLLSCVRPLRVGSLDLVPLSYR
jgi:hypothetical protein